MKNLTLIIKLIILIFLIAVVIGLGTSLYRKFYGDSVIDPTDDPVIDDGGGDDDGGGTDDPSGDYDFEVEDITLNETEIVF